MSRLIKSRNCLMKCMGFVLLFGFISLGAIGGCNNNGGDTNNKQALTENDFSEDASLSARPGGGVVVDFLEPPGGEKPERDTGDVGTDIVPYRYNQTTEHTFCWEDDDPGAAHFMTLVDSDGEEVLTIEVNGDCVTQVIEKGNYEMRLHHDGVSEETLAIFIQPLVEEQVAENISRELGIIKTVKRLLEETLRNIGISTEARAQSVAQNVQTLLDTNNCEKCDLVDANLTGALLVDANLTGALLTGALLPGALLTAANLTGAGLARANLSEAVLPGANLLKADLLETNLNMANLIGADLTGAFVFMADLTDANLTQAILSMATLGMSNLTGTNLSMANLTQATLRMSNLSMAFLYGTNLSGVILDSTNFEDATWCDGMCICGMNSVDICVGCAAIDTCTGP